MDNWEDPTPIESNPSSSEPNSLPIPVPVSVVTSSTNSNTESEGNPASRSNKRKTSEIWDHFKKLDGNVKAPRAACMYYGKDYACHTILNGTSNMWSHLGVCKKFPFVIDRKQKTLVLEFRPIIKRGNNGEENLVTIKAVGYSYEECRKALGKMIILDELLFNFVENQGFKSFCQVMQPRFDVPSRLTI
jgi:hypothetical protein